VKKILLALACIYIIWGSTFLAVRYVLEAFPPLAMSGARFGVAGTVLYLYCLSRCPRPTWQHWRSALIIGTLMLTAGTGLVAWAEQTVTSGQAALLNASTPMWIALWTFYRKGYPGHPTLAGIVLATAGVATLVGGGEQWNLGSLAVLLASLSWTAAILISPTLNKPASSVQFSGMTMICAGVLLLALSKLSGEHMLGPITLTAIASWIYLVVAGSLIGLTVYTWLLDKASPALVATHTYVNPMVAVALAALVGEPLPASLPTAVVLVVAGVACLGLKDIAFPERVFRTYIPLVGQGQLS
jgi:drug/metabolite transporter (DMT)-like permease